jgi:protease-4
MRTFLAVLFSSILLLAGCTPSFLITPVSNNNELVEKTVDDGKGFFPKKIVIIPIEGTILNSRKPGLLVSGENSLSLLSQQLKRAEKDPAVAAIVLRLNSPGGTVTASDSMYQLISDFKKSSKKPVIASVQEVCASGGYYSALAADEIIAQPTSVVGSIGVIFEMFDVEGTLGKIGARAYIIKSGPLKDMGSPLKPLSEAERQVIQAMIMQYYARFQGIVQNRRALSTEELQLVTDGRVFSGQDALKLKLIDRLGTLNDAIDIARQRADAKGAKAVLYIRPHGYGGSIYASNEMPAPEANTTQLSIPLADEIIPAGFYYLWRPGL